MTNIQHGTSVPEDLAAWEETFSVSPVAANKYISFGIKISVSPFMETAQFDFYDVNN